MTTSDQIQYAREQAEAVALREAIRRLRLFRIKVQLAELQCNPAVIDETARKMIERGAI